MRFILLITIFVSLNILSCSDDDTNSEEQLSSISFTGSRASCSDLVIYILESEENNQTSLTISGTGKDELGLSEELKMFELPNENLTIEISTWDLSVNGYFCNDVATDPSPEQTGNWAAISGNISMSILNVEESPIGGVDYYDLSVTLENVIFENAAGNQLEIESLALTDVAMGFLPG